MKWKTASFSWSVHTDNSWDSRELRLLLTQNWTYPWWPSSNFVMCVCLQVCVCKYCSRHYLPLKQSYSYGERCIEDSDGPERDQWQLTWWFVALGWKGIKFTYVFRDRTLWLWYFGQYSGIVLLSSSGQISHSTWHNGMRTDLNVIGELTFF